MSQNNSAKFAFFYMLSLVALIFMALSTGIIIFQIINKNIVDAINVYRGNYSSDALKFAISAIIISAPLYYFSVLQINKNLFSGALGKDSAIRKWLTYLILFISSVVMAGWVVGTIYNFLDGELTFKFILKSLTSIGIAATIFSYYFYDIKRENTQGVKDGVVKGYFVGSLVVILICVVSAFIFVESPTETRNRKHDNNILASFSQIDNAMETYYMSIGELPADLDELVEEIEYLETRGIENPATKKEFGYNVVGAKSYELCANFKTSTYDHEDDNRYYYQKEWKHEAGEQCLDQKVRSEKTIDSVRVITEPLLKR